jgi:hypothetical protein
VRIGEETNWLNVVRDSHFYSVLLLKTDGTLWRWGTNHWKQAWPGLRSFVPQPIVAEHDWASIVSAGSSIYAWKQNGEAWIYDSGFENHPRLLQRWPGFDKTKWRSLSQVARFQAGVREDGTAWLWGLSAPPSSGEEGVQIGHGSDWVAVALSRLELVGLKADGSLWQWNFGYSQNRRMWFPGAPVRLGTHHDWVAVGHTHDGIFSLAADGSLWCWWDRDSYSGALLATSRRPTRIENIFDQVE